MYTWKSSLLQQVAILQDDSGGDLILYSVNYVEIHPPQ